MESADFVLCLYDGAAGRDHFTHSGDEISSRSARKATISASCASRSRFASAISVTIKSKGLPQGYLPWMGINVEDVLTELRRPRPALAYSNPTSKNPPSRSREG